MRVLIAIPVLNEEKVLGATVRAVRDFCDRNLPQHEVTIVIADNGSRDGTEAVGRRLAEELRGVRYLQLAGRGKGLAIREAWSGADADAYVFMDADLATDIAALPDLVGRIGSGADLAVGSRFHPASVVRRSAFRRLMSRGYRELLSLAFGTRVADAPCGFKAASASLVRDVVPHVTDDKWFFDTELVVRAERAGRKIEEVPVTWREEQPAGRRSKVRVAALVQEYVSKVLRLRRALGPTPRQDAAPRAGMRALLSSVGRNERLFVLAVAAVIAVVTTIPPMLGAWIGAIRGVEWSGRQFLSPGDFGVYLSYIAQVKNGHLLFENMATTEALTPVLNVLWLAVGLLARAFDFTPITAFHVARVALIFPFAAVAYAAIAYVFRDIRHRAAAFVLFALSSGLGLYVAPFLPAAGAVGGSYEWPIDFWVGEANAFLSMLYTPHFIASWTLIILVLLLLLMAFDADDARYGAWAGVVALVLFQFHPFHVPTLYAVGGVALLLRTRVGGFRERQWAAYLLFLAISLPSVAYHYWLTHWSPNAAFMLDNNITTTPSPFHVLVGFGAVSALAIIGYRRDDDEGTMRPSHRQFLAAWAVTQLLLVYFPFVFQRRLLEGLQFPLVLLSVPALVAARRWLMRKPGLGPAFATTYGVLIAAAVFLPSTVSAVMRSVDAYVYDRPPIYFFDADRSAALAWLREMTPKDAVVLTGVEEGNLVVGWGERKTYAGHWANTIALSRKQDEIASFFDRATTPEDRGAFLAANGIDYVLEGVAERREGGTLDRDPNLAEAFRAGGTIIYRVIR